MKKVLALNTGSSSVKFALYGFGEEERKLLEGSLSGIGREQGSFSVSLAGSSPAPLHEEGFWPDHEAACNRIFSWLRDEAAQVPDAIAHRMVHGGARHAEPAVLTANLVTFIEGLVPYAPEHLPQALRAAQFAAGAYPGLVQVACFDTAFHRTMPDVARRYPLPAIFRRRGLERFGFHGLSYHSVIDTLEREKPGSAMGRLLIAHLGHGASMAAVLEGRSVETTMGFSPAGGMVMGTRTGDLDPGVMLFLLREGEDGAAWLGELLNHHSGLLGVSGRTSDMRDLLKAEAAGDGAAGEAVELFCYHAIRHAGALIAVLGGLDGMVFTGGIGEHSPLIRERICRGLAFIGIELDGERNGRNDCVVSSARSRVRVRVVGSDEERMIATEACRLLEAGDLWHGAGECG